MNLPTFRIHEPIIFHLCQPLTSERYSLWRDHSRKNLIYIGRFKYNTPRQHTSIHRERERERETLRVSVNADHVKIIFGIHTGASLANSSGCRFPDRASSIPRSLCVFACLAWGIRRCEEEWKNKAHFYLGNDEKPGCLGGTMARPMLHTRRNEAGRRDPRYWKDKIKRKELLEQSEIRRERERERETTVKECKCKDALHPQFRSALQSIIWFTWENLQAPREWGGFVSDRRFFLSLVAGDINLKRGHDNEEDSSGECQHICASGDRFFNLFALKTALEDRSLSIVDVQWDRIWRSWWKL